MSLLFTSEFGRVLPDELSGWSVIRNNGVHEVYDTEAEARAAFAAEIDAVSECVRNEQREPRLEYLPLVTSRGYRGLRAEITSTELCDGVFRIRNDGWVDLYRRKSSPDSPSLLIRNRALSAGKTTVPPYPRELVTKLAAAAQTSTPRIHRWLAEPDRHPLLWQQLCQIARVVLDGELGVTFHHTPIADSRKDQ